MKAVAVGAVALVAGEMTRAVELGAARARAEVARQAVPAEAALMETAPEIRSPCSRALSYTRSK